MFILYAHYHKFKCWGMAIIFYMQCNDQAHFNHIFNSILTSLAHFVDGFWCP